MYGLLVPEAPQVAIKLTYTIIPYRVERLPSLNASDVHHITRPIPPIRGRQGNPRRPSRNWVKGPISSWLE